MTYMRIYPLTRTGSMFFIIGF